MDKKAIRDLAIEAGLQAVPYVGGAIATAYFGPKLEIRLKRIESFYEEISSEFEAVKDSFKSIENHDEGTLAAILESLHENVELEPTTEKRKFFKNYLKSTLIDPIKNNYDERNYFLLCLKEMSLLECELLALLQTQTEQVQVDALQKPGSEQYAIVGAVNRLKSRGFLASSPGRLSIGGSEDNALLELVTVSSYGRKFHSFCLGD